MNTNGPDQPNDHPDELSLLNIVEFIQEFWRTVASFTLIGIASATLFLWATPNQYEAIAQIKMAQIANANNNINLQGTNIEEPLALIARMALPTSYSKETIALCGLAEQKDATVILASKIKFSTIKGMGGIIELKVRDASKDAARACAEAVYQLIKISQGQLVAPYIDEARKKIAIEEERLDRANQVIAKADRSGTAVSAAYLATRDEIRYLRDQISNLQNIIAGNESRTTQLIAPIYLKEQPVFPQKRNSLLVGLLLGGFLGLALALVRKWYRSNLATLKHRALKKLNS